MSWAISHELAHLTTRIHGTGGGGGEKEASVNREIARKPTEIGR